MGMTDPVADMLTRIRNGNSIGRSEVMVPVSKLKLAIADVLEREGFIQGYEIGPTPRTFIVKLKYGPDGEKVINEIARKSKPGLRVYHGVTRIAKILNGMGISIVSTSKGVLSDRECREKKVGGEILASVW